LYTKGDEVEAIILSINHDEKKVSLGIKQIYDDPWSVILTDYLPGKVVDEMTVISVVDYGAFVRIVPGIEALIPNDEIPDGATPHVGDKVRGEIANLDATDRRVTVTLKNIGETSRVEQVKAVKREAEAVARSSAGTLGDLLKEKLGDKLQSMKDQSSAPSDTDPQ
jgi:small subunit ribosomal protein S1